MENNNIMIDVTCFSKKVDVSIGFGFDEEYMKLACSSINEAIEECAADAFWENCYEFETGIEKAKELLANNKFPTYREALVEIFGNFAFSFEIDGLEKELVCSIDPDELMYSLLEQV